MLKDLAKVFFEKLSPVRVAKPLNLRVPTQSERILALVRHEYALANMKQEVETFEDADDFSMEEEEWFSPYEEVFEAPSEPVPEPVVTPPAEPAPAPVVGEG